MPIPKARSAGSGRRTPNGEQIAKRIGGRPRPPIAARANRSLAPPGQRTESSASRLPPSKTKISSIVSIPPRRALEAIKSDHRANGLREAYVRKARSPAAGCPSTYSTPSKRASARLDSKEICSGGASVSTRMNNSRPGKDWGRKVKTVSAPGRMAPNGRLAEARSVLAEGDSLKCRVTSASSSGAPGAMRKNKPTAVR